MTTTDPTWPPIRIIAWAITAVFVGVMLASTVAEAVAPGPKAYTDFLQEWLAAQNHFTGHSIYRPVAESSWEHIQGREGPIIPLQFTHEQTGTVIAEMRYNAHPPVSVLAALPFCYLEYTHARMAWNAVMCVLFAVTVVAVIRELKLPFPWPCVFPAFILCLANPILIQVYQGQLNFLLAFLLTAAWLADRRGRGTLAGVCVGIAGALKLFPLFLLAYFLFTRRWSGLVASIVSFLALNALAAALFGIEAFEAYARQVVPDIAAQFQGSVANMSLTGFWLQVVRSDMLRELVGPEVGNVIAKGMSLAVVVLVILACRKATGLWSRDRAFAVTLVGMLLVSPITWSHYLTILLVPLGLCWARLRSIGRGATLVVLVVFWLPHDFVLNVVAGPERVALASPTGSSIRLAEVLFCVAVPHYALLGLFVLTLLLPREETHPESVEG